MCTPRRFGPRLQILTRSGVLFKGDLHTLDKANSTILLCNVSMVNVNDWYQSQSGKFDGVLPYALFDADGISEVRDLRSLEQKQQEHSQQGIESRSDVFFNTVEAAENQSVSMDSGSSNDDNTNAVITCVDPAINSMSKDHLHVKDAEFLVIYNDELNEITNLPAKQPTIDLAHTNISTTDQATTYTVNPSTTNLNSTFKASASHPPTNNLQISSNLPPQSAVPILNGSVTYHSGSPQFGSVSALRSPINFVRSSTQNLMRPIRTSTLVPMSSPTCPATPNTIYKYFNRRPHTSTRNMITARDHPVFHNEREYDFQKANAFYEEICRKLEESGLVDEKHERTASSGGDASGEDDDELAEINECVTPTPTPTPHTDPSMNKLAGKHFYNPADSFFDYISTKVTQKYPSHLPTWRSYELNTLTFGSTTMKWYDYAAKPFQYAGPQFQRRFIGGRSAYSNMSPSYASSYASQNWRSLNGFRENTARLSNSQNGSPASSKASSSSVSSTKTAADSALGDISQEFIQSEQETSFKTLSKPESVQPVISKQEKAVQVGLGVNNFYNSKIFANPKNRQGSVLKYKSSAPTFSEVVREGFNGGSNKYTPKPNASKFPTIISPGYVLKRGVKNSPASLILKDDSKRKPSTSSSADTGVSCSESVRRENSPKYKWTVARNQIFKAANVAKFDNMNKDKNSYNTNKII